MTTCPKSRMILIAVCAIGAFCLLTPSRTSAQQPVWNISPRGFIGGTTVYVVGALNNTPDPAGEFAVYVTSASTGQPAPAGLAVTATIPAGGDVHFYEAKTTWFDPALAIHHVCQHANSATTSVGPDGYAVFRITGYATHGPDCHGGSGSDGTISVVGGNTQIHFNPACFDHDGRGVGINDLSLFLGDLGCLGQVAHADYDASGTVGG